MNKEKDFFEEHVFSDKNHFFTFEKDKELIKNILKYKKAGKILDIGCGEAGTSLVLAEKGFDVTCVDISKTVIKEIRDEAKRRNIEIDAVIDDLETFNISKNYDIVIGTGIFHFISKEKVLDLIDKLKNCTKEGGINVFEVFLQGDPSQDESSEGYYFNKNELKNIYSKWEIIDYDEYEEYDKKEKHTNKMAFFMAKKPIKTV